MIPFPKMHIAQSALNRIQNTLEEVGPLGLEKRKPLPTNIQEAPEVPNPTAIGQAINTQIETPTQPVEVPPGAEDAVNHGMLESSVMGGSPFDGALIGMGS